MSQIRIDPTEKDLAVPKEAVRLLKQHPRAFVTSLPLTSLMAAQFEAWIWVGDLHVNHLDRSCWAETIALAQEVTRTGKDLK